MTVAFRRGDIVRIEYEGHTSVLGMIALASRNNKSIMLGFESIIDGHVGAMPVSLGTDGVYRSIVTGIEVRLTRVRTH